MATILRWPSSVSAGVARARAAGAGLAQASSQAFKKTEQYRSGRKIGGITPLLRFFLGYALGWMFHEREAILHKALLSDVHATAKWGVLGPMSNTLEFHAAFGVRTNQPMWRTPEVQVKIW